MPAAVAAAVVGSVVTSAATTAIAGAIGAGFMATALGAVAGGLASSVVGAAFSDSPDASPGVEQFRQELRDNLVTVRQPITHWQYIYGRTRVSGALTFAHETADQYFHLIITYAGHVCEEIEAIQFNDEVVPLDGSGNATGKYAGHVRIKKSLGAEAGQPFPDLVAESEGKWTDAHRQSGRTKIYVRLKFNIDLFPNGVPNITAVIKGKKVYDPRTGLTAWSENASLCQADFLCDPHASLGCVYADEIDEAQLIAAANIDDEPVNLAGGGTEARYTVNGAFSVNAEPRATLGRLLTANAGKARYIGGVWRIHPAAYVAPTITLSEDDVRAVPHITPRLSASDLSNRVKGLYVSEDNHWQPTDFPPITNATYLAEDENEPSWRELDLPFTKSAATAQRIAKIELEKMRQQIGVEWPGKFTCYRLQPGDTVRISFAMLGWVEKVYEVEQAGLVFEGGEDGIRLGTDLVLRETASTVFDWSSGEETAVDPAPDTNLPDPFTVAAISGLALSSGTSDLFVAGDGSVFSRIKASWTAPTDRFVSEGGRILVQFKRSADSEWQDASPLVGGAAQTYLSPVDDGVAYDVRVRAENSIGVRGAWATVTSHTVIGKTAAPSDVTGFAAQQQGDAVVFICDQVGDADLDLVEVRLLDEGDTTWANGIPKANILRGYTVTSAAIPPGTWTFLAKARDTSGNYSATAARFDLTVSADGYTTIRSAEASPDWPGTLTNFVRHWTGVLVPDSTVTAGSYSGNEWIDSFVPDPAASCTYEAAEIDKGIDVPARVWGDIVSVLGPGETTGIANPKLQVDYKLAAGAYDGYEDWTIGTVPFRYVKGKIVLDTSIGVAKITGFALNIDRQPVTEERRGIVVGAGGTAVTFTNAFHSTPMLTAHNDGSSPLLPTHGSDSATGTTIHLFNTSGSDVGGTGGYTAIGA